MFAEAGIENLSFTQVGIGVAFLVLCLQTAALIVTLASSRKAQRREVSFETVFATRESVDEVRGEVRDVKQDVVKLRNDIVSNGEDRRIRIEQKVEEARNETREAAAELHEKINGVANQVGGIEAKCELMNQQMLGVDTKIMRLLERTPRSAATGI